MLVGDSHTSELPVCLKKYPEMPGNNSMFGELDHCLTSPGSGLEDQRALQLALELSMLGLTSESLSAMTSSASFMTAGGSRASPNLSAHQQHHNHGFESGLLTSAHHHQNNNRDGCGGNNGGLQSLFSSTSSLGSVGGMSACHNLLMSPPDESYRSTLSGMLPKKSQNMTECVPVPSSEHVAEIVGRQGMFEFLIVFKTSLICYLCLNMNYLKSQLSLY